MPYQGDGAEENEKKLRREDGSCPGCPKVDRYPTMLLIDAKTGGFLEKFVMQKQKRLIPLFPYAYPEPYLGRS